MKPPKFFVQGRYSSIYRIYCGYEAPVPGPIKPQNLSNEHDAHAFIIRLRLDHAFCLTILHAVDGLTVNSDVSLAYSRRDLARLSWGWHYRIRFYPLDPFAYDFITPRNNHYPVIRPAQDTAPRGMACHFVPATILLMSDPNPADVTFFGLDEGTQARDFLHSLALTDEQLAMMIETLKLRAWPNRTDRLKSLLMALTSGNIVIVRIYDDNITPPKRKGPEDLPVEEYTPKPYTLGPRDEPGYVPPARVSKNATERRKENYQERKQIAAKAGNTPEQQAAAARLLDNNDNILRAEAAAYVYQVDEFNRGHIDTLPDAPTGLNLIDPKEIPGLENATFTDEETGFGAALFESDVNDETMLTFRGTNNGVTGMKDWGANFSQGLGRETAQYEQAMDLAKLVKVEFGGDFVTVGHSLAGGLASAATAVAGVKGYTYNAAGLHPDTATRKGGMSNKTAGKQIQTRAVEGEVLTGAQRHGNNVLSGLGAGGGAFVAGLVGAGLGYLASKALPDIPEALGEMKTLPSVNGGSPVTRHGMNQVIDGIEAQKKEDIKILSFGP